MACKKVAHAFVLLLCSQKRKKLACQCKTVSPLTICLIFQFLIHTVPSVSKVGNLSLVPYSLVLLGKLLHPPTPEVSLLDDITRIILHKLCNASPIATDGIIQLFSQAE